MRYEGLPNDWSADSDEAASLNFQISHNQIMCMSDNQFMPQTSAMLV